MVHEIVGFILLKVTAQYKRIENEKIAFLEYFNKTDFFAQKQMIKRNRNRYKIRIDFTILLN